ncbi:4Fe-4S ferredoxin [Metallosphaera tengchongensis]|uniref:4Fe-4S ferredoxin n=1 Tax=Metallosphaera tengchongensis TaxID=1532350 RepID=A0A6N0NV90_9CREN|nr:4Fe-4S ferredoxin [Metallosphaera tengchongensis]QKR00784.1 4Fe-4S ferredoxin [Metallosphaera tengchongensis]
MNPFQTLVLLYLVGMMSVDLSVLYYVLRKPLVSRGAVLFTSSILLYMSLEAMDLGYIIFRHGSLLEEPVTLTLASVPALLSLKGRDSVIRWRSDLRLASVLGLTLVLDELSMGYLYSLGFGPDLNPLVSSVSNPAFGAMMLADAVFFLALAGVRDLREISVFTFAVSMSFMPNVFISFPRYVLLVTSVLSSAVMVVNIVTLYLLQMKSASFNVQLLSFSLAGLDLFMMLGLVTLSSGLGMELISTSMIISMVWYFVLVLHNFPDRRTNLGLKHALTFLALVNLTELVMGLGNSVLGFTVTNSMYNHVGVQGMGNTMGKTMSMSPFSNPFWWLFPMDPLVMVSSSFTHMLASTHDLLLTLVYTSYVAVMATTMTPFYVIMMGAEMGFLVYERYRNVTRIKGWTLAILVGVPVFVWLIPYYTNLYVFGMSGMIFPVTVLSFTLSLMGIALASTLFGKRAYCNLVCMSAHMWSNAFYDRFKPKRTHRFWEYFRWFPFTLMVITFVYWALDELTQSHAEVDPLNLYGMFTLNYVWWFFFFLTPIFGTYSCSRQGWCGFGTFVGLFNKVLFKVRAKDVETCRSCNTVECEGACPIKIEVREDVLSKRYVNRISCVGCGDCVESCPHENLIITDVRKRG